MRLTARTLFFIAILTLIPFIGLCDFHTKGEPREAVVALTMLDTGNWILPVNNGEEIAYKPPMFHWLVALASLPMGHVTEFTARIPSALAAIVTALATFLFFARRRGDTVGLLTALVMLTTFEVHRAAMACRVDMVLTMFIVLALYGMLSHVERGGKGVPWLALLCMSGGMLTKGPVAIVLPLLVAYVYYGLLHRPRGLAAWLRLTGQYAAFALLALVLPAVWYYAAWKQGGDGFLYLVYEENVLRFLGRMPYRSHEKGLYYYPLVLLGGLLPYTLLLFAPCFKGRAGNRFSFAHLWARLKARVQRADTVELASMLSVGLILLFYCIPKSKRSVYILPIYPFLSFFIALALLRLQRVRPAALKAFFWTLAGLTGLLVVMLTVVESGWLPANLLGDKLAPMVRAIAEGGGLDFMCNYALIAAMLIAIYCYYALRRLPEVVNDTIYTLLVLLMLLDAVVLPAALSAKSDKPYTAQILHDAQGEKVWTFVDDPDRMMHFFTLNFYADNTLGVFPEKRLGTTGHQTKLRHEAEPRAGLLLVGDKDRERFAALHPEYSLTLVSDYHHCSCDVKQDLQLWRFVRE